MVKVANHSSLEFPLSITYTKQNTGKEAEIAGHLSKETKYTLRKKYINQGYNKMAQFSEHILKEGTLYRGLHTMSCEIKDKNGKLVFYDIISVLIK